MSEFLVQSLRLKRYPLFISVTGVGDRDTITKGITNFSISSRLYHNANFHINAFILKKITTYLPQCNKTQITWELLKICH